MKRDTSGLNRRVVEAAQSMTVSDTGEEPGPKTLVLPSLLTLQSVTGIVEPNLGEVVDAVRSGSFDFLLLKPIDAQVLASIRRVAPARL